MPHRKSGKTTRKVARSTARSGSGSGRATSSRATTRRTHEPRRPPIPSEPTAPEVIARAPTLPPHELYRHEKRRRAGQQRGDGPDPLEEARRVFQAMIEAGVGTPRGGRPRKVKPRPEDDEE
jgi:hypothetical protein